MFALRPTSTKTLATLFRTCSLSTQPQKSSIYIPQLSEIPSNLRYDNTTKHTYLLPSTSTRESVDVKLPPFLKPEVKVESLDLVQADFSHLIRDYGTLQSHGSTITEEMLTLKIHNLFNPQGDAASGSFTLPSDIFGLPLRIDILQRVTRYQAAQKRGVLTAKTKNITANNGSGAKRRPQKGGGTSRMGHGRPSQFRKGAKSHGPKGNIVDYSKMKINCSVRRLGVLGALSQKLREGNVVLVEGFERTGAEGESSGEGFGLTKDIDVSLTNLLGVKTSASLNGKSKPYQTLILTASSLSDANEEVPPQNLILATRNLRNVHVLNAGRGVNTMDVLRSEKIVVCMLGVRELIERF